MASNDSKVAMPTLQHTKISEIPGIHNELYQTFHTQKNSAA